MYEVPTDKKEKSQQGARPKERQRSDEMIKDVEGTRRRRGAMRAHRRRFCGQRGPP
ncbi:p069 [Rhizobium phage 16-3]|uniref:p069 n=1 Tax=Rhizobium phage 16-3 TaxID=10704 RepID=UPI00017BA616|nr:p069 [Rhizobium phage 16-3]ABF71323.1 p069 [Rhizobium phage 16-3]